MTAATGLPLPLLGLTLGLSFGLAWLGGSPAWAGSATATSSLGQQDAMKKARERMPAGAVMKRYECRDVVQPLVRTSHACTIHWDPVPAQPQP
jgi:hypothetical protein